ncbi:MAG: preprotein translocase subunit YajC [Candidatus Omnitrophica bacterium]|nr:preprotein translocase subunit YajC [Candidatus Omnitrophota bacterium]
MENLFQSAIVPYLLIFLIFYFLIIKPQQKKQKEQKEMLQNLKKNQQVVTAGGIHGTIVSVKEKTVVVRVDDSVKIEFDKESVSAVINKK